MLTCVIFLMSFSTFYICNHFDLFWTYFWLVFILYRMLFCSLFSYRNFVKYLNLIILLLIFIATYFFWTFKRSLVLIDFLTFRTPLSFSQSDLYSKISCLCSSPLLWTRLLHMLNFDFTSPVWGSVLCFRSSEGLGYSSSLRPSYFGYFHLRNEDYSE